jgi:uncharacterized membrane-anchored protein
MRPHNMMLIWLRQVLCLMTFMGSMSLAAAQGAGQDASADKLAAQRQADMAAAIKAAEDSQIKGPADIALRDQGKLKLPAGYVWIPEPAASKLMKAMGNHPDERELGLLFPDSNDENWLIVAEYESSGYIKDDDAKNWDVDALFKSLKEGTEAANEERRQQGFDEMDIVGWVEKPTYTADTHRLVWSISTRHKGASADAPMNINYNTYALGREGYVTLNLITALNAVDKDKHHARTLLDALSFNEGKRYADFNSSTDKVAEYGLAALVGGLAAKKLGMFALAAGFFAKFAKIILLAGAGIVAALTKFFKRDKRQG